MHNTYFEIEDDNRINSRWYLDEITSIMEDVNIWDFISAKGNLKYEKLIAPIQYPGPALDFTFAAFDVPIVKESIGSLLEKYSPCNLQRLPVAIEGVRGRYEIINITNAIECFDKKKSVYDLWTERDMRPDLLGHPRSVVKLKIDKSIIKECDHIFRIKTWLLPIIVSDVLKIDLERLGVRGIRFKEV